jgi:hypothetical protein
MDSVGEIPGRWGRLSQFGPNPAKPSNQPELSRTCGLSGSQFQSAVAGFFLDQYYLSRHWNELYPQNLKNLANLPSEIIQRNLKFIF